MWKFVLFIFIVLQGCAKSNHEPAPQNSSNKEIDSNRIKFETSIKQVESAQSTPPLSVDFSGQFLTRPSNETTIHKKQKKHITEILDTLENNVLAVWGEQEKKISNKIQIIKYLDGYKTRAIIDFEKGEIIVETINIDDELGTIHNSVRATFNLPADLDSANIFDDNTSLPITESGLLLEGLITDAQGNSITPRNRLEKKVKEITNDDIKKRKSIIKGKSQEITYVKIPLAKNYLQKLAQKYKPEVLKYSNEYNMDPELVFAVIKTESSFNPLAISPVPAYGLMQLVPTTGGRDAYKHAKSRDIIPSKEYLFDAKNNIELGTAYLNLVKFTYLKLIQDEISRELCTIASYNTGTGNVFKTFGKSKKMAIKRINALSAEEVYNILITKLPYAETRNYVKKVIKARSQFLKFSII